MTKVVLFGSRTLPARAHKRIDDVVYFLGNLRDDICIVAGGAKGADSAAEKSAYKHGDLVSFEKYPADWEKYGKGAGFKRNMGMITDSVFGVAFWQNRNNPSKGTAHSVQCLMKQGKFWGEYDAMTGAWFWCGVEVRKVQFYHIINRKLEPDRFCSPERHVDPHRGCVLR